jgi:hypothetical protein
MPFDAIFLLAIPVLLVAGMIVQFIRARRDGLRGRSALIAIFKPFRLFMQGSASAHGLPAPRLEVVDSPNSHHKSSTPNS